MTEIPTKTNFLSSSENAL